MNSGRILVIFVWSLIALAHLAGMFLDIQEIDAAQYACMGREMLDSGSFLQLYDGPKPYLDKPPLTFWCTALSYFLFGVSNFSYRLPSVLFSLWATYSTYRLGSLLHGKQTGMVAAVIFASCQAVFLMNNDVKTDMYMLAPMVFSAWKMIEFGRGAGWLQVFWAAVGVGLAMLAKGPIGFVVPVAVAGADILWRRDWKHLFQPAWFIGIPVLALVLAPFTWGQYQQYGTGGVVFFFWTQSFGRITGESEWANDATAFFFVHTFAWAFLPWTPFFLLALIRKLKSVFKNWKSAEIAPIFGFIFIFAALSASRFKLPHYIFIAAPFAAIVLAEYVQQMSHSKAIQVMQTVFLTLLSASAVVLALWSFPDAPLALKLISTVAILGTLAWCFFERDFIKRTLWAAAGVMASINLMLNLVLYPELLQYQSTAQAGKLVSGENVPHERTFAHRVSGRAYNFYAGAVVRPWSKMEDALDVLQGGSIWMYTDSTGLEDLRSKSTLKIENSIKLPHFRVNRITFPFLNPNLRPKVTSTRYLIEIGMAHR